MFVNCKEHPIWLGFVEDYRTFSLYNPMVESVEYRVGELLKVA